MKYGEFNINQAQGVVLCSDIWLDKKFYPMGHKLNADDIIIFKMFDLFSVYGAVYEDGDVDYKIALNQVAAHLCAKDLGYMIGDDNMCHIVAGSNGIFAVNQARIDKFNRYNDNFVLNTIAPYSMVKKGDIVAKVEALSPLIREEQIDELLFGLSGNDYLLKLNPLEARKVLLIYPHLLGDEQENQHFTSVVMKFITDMDGTGLEYGEEISCKYNRTDIVNAIYEAVGKNADLVVILSPTNASGKQSLVAQCIEDVAEDVVNYHIPQTGASNLIIAQIKKCKIVSLPFSYDSVLTKNIAQNIKRAVFTEHLNNSDFANLGTSVLESKEVVADEKAANLIMPATKKGSGQKASIGIVVLAAGQGRRSGANKLLVENNENIPLFMKAVNAAIASEAKPVFVVTGYRNEEMEQYLAKLDINILYNPAFASGIKTSINLGLKSVPSSCDGAILLPADMPYITETEINKLISKFDKTQEKQVCVLSNKGVKSNPVLWSKSLYHKADIVPENAALRAVFVEHADYTKQIEIKDKKKLVDVNLPSDVTDFADN